MDFTDFMRIEREDRGGSKHYIIHTRDPKFSLELVPDRDAPDNVGKGVIKRICVPNSCLGDYTRCSAFITAAQEFFRQSFAAPVPKTVTRRFHS